MFRYTALALCAVVVAAGCTQKDKVIGTWTTQVQAAGGSFTAETTFGEGGTYTADAEGGGGQIPMKLKIHQVGNWKHTSGDSYDIKLTDMTLTPEGGDPKMAATLTQLIDKNKATALDQENKNSAVTITWQGDSKFTLNRGGKSQEFTRKAS